MCLALLVKQSDNQFALLGVCLTAGRIGDTLTDGSADFRNINAAVSKLKEGQYVEILDAGPYRERLDFKPPANTGLISRADTVIQLPEWIRLDGPFGPAGHVIKPYESFRLHGISFTYERIRNGWILEIPHGFHLIISNCIFAGRGGTELGPRQPFVMLHARFAGKSSHPDMLLIGNVFNDPLHLWAHGSRQGRVTLKNNLFLGHNVHYSIVPRGSDLENRVGAEALPSWEFEIDRNVFFDLLGGKAFGILVDHNCAPAFSIRLTHNTLVGRRYPRLLEVADEKVLKSAYIHGNVIASDGREVNWPAASQRNTWVVEDNVLESAYPESNQANHVRRPNFQSIDLQSSDFLRPGPGFPKTSDKKLAGALQSSNPGEGSDWLSKSIQRWLALRKNEPNNGQ